MKIPEKITVVGLEYDVQLKPGSSSELCSGGANGYHSSQTCVLIINSDLSDQQKEITFLHELTHAVHDALNISFDNIQLDERYVDSFSRVWYEILKQIY